MNGYSWRISYGDGSSASGDVYKDTVTVGSVTAQSQAVEAASQISQQFTQDPNNDGLLGLAFSSINTGMVATKDKKKGFLLTRTPVKPQAQTTFFDTVKEDLDSPLFAVTLKHGAPGSYDFGFVDQSKYTGSLTYADVDNSQGFWMFTASGYAIGDQASSTSISGIAGMFFSLSLSLSPTQRKSPTRIFQLT